MLVMSNPLFWSLRWGKHFLNITVANWICQRMCYRFEVVFSFFVILCFPSHFIIKKKVSTKIHKCYIICFPYSKKTSTVYHKGRIEAFFFYCFKISHLTKSQVPFKKDPNMENYRKSHRVILVNLESDFQYAGNSGRPSSSIICCPCE